MASRDLSRAQQYAKEFNFKKAYGSYDEVATDEEVEVVYIGTIPQTHVELSIKMLEAGKHVLCEKPMAMKLKDVKRVFETAKKTGKLFMEGLWSKFTPAYEQIRLELAKQSIGDVRLVQANFCIKVPADSLPRSGGMLEIGIYSVLLACMAFNEMPERIQASGVMTDNKEMDIGGCIILKYKNGGMANLAYHFETDPFNTSGRIMGTKGAIEIPDWFFCPTKISSPNGTFEFPLKPGKYFYPRCSGLFYEVEAMREMVKKGKIDTDIYTMADSEMIITIAEEVRRQIGVICPEV